MADRKTLPTVEGETRFGPDNPNHKIGQGVLYIPSSNVASKGSVLALDGVDSNGACTTWYFFVTSAGVLRRHSSFPTNTESDGSAV